MLPVSVKVGERSLSVLIDAAFAFSPMGLLTTMRLAQVARVWLPRALRGILDKDAFYRNRPEQLGAAWLPSEERRALTLQMAGALSAWQQAWTYGRLSTQVHWIGDARYESSLPERSDGAVLPRFEACCAALAGRFNPQQAARASVLDDCVRDSLALACALQPETTVILAACSGPDRAPALCGYLEAAGIAAQRFGGALPLKGDRRLADALMPAIATQQAAAFVHLIAPGALTLPDAWSGDDWSLDDVSADGGEGSRAYVWEGALALWQPLEAAS
jgi:hypothetical protein